MIKTPYISVVMPVWNAAQTLEKALTSVINQTFSDWELIAVDDGSTDNTTSLLQNAAISDSRIQILTLSHVGIVRALNAGMAMAKGRYVARADSDDVLRSDRLERQAAFLDKHDQTDVVSCLVEYAGDRSTCYGFASYVDWSNSVRSYREISMYRFVESPIVHPSMMCRQTLWQKSGGYREGPFPEDYDLWLRWLSEGVCIEKIPQPLLEWHDGPSRLSRVDDRYAVESFYALKAEYLSRWLLQNNRFYPNVIIWGAGRLSRQRAECLTQWGIEIRAYVDIDPRKVGQSILGRRVLSVEELPDAGSAFVIPYVGSRGARSLIIRALERKGYRLGVDYICAA